MVLRQCIERHLAGFESTCTANSGGTSLRGDETERFAIAWLRTRGYLLVARRLKTPYAEIDLLIRNPVSKEWLVVEVKSSLWPDGLALGLSRKQRARLWRASLWIQDELVQILSEWTLKPEALEDLVTEDAEDLDVRLNLVLLVREEGMMHCVGFRFLPIF